jgi:5-methyltetrahydrofolate--homocysteine methyltransferase
MKKAVAHLEQYLEKKEGTSKGLVVLATVYGDVHDIGKNLVKTILANNGYTVIDLGKQVPAETIISKAAEAGADAIGLSALLVNTSKQMPLIVNELQRRGLKLPVLVGGAAINRRFGWRILYTENGELYEPGVFYQGCLRRAVGDGCVERLTSPAPVAGATAQRSRTETERSKAETTKGPSAAHSKIVARPLSPAAYPLGAKVVRSMPLEMVFQHLFKNELFRLSWGAKNTHGEEWEHLKAEFEARLERMQREALRTGWLKPQGVYGYWPCQAQGNELRMRRRPHPGPGEEGESPFNFPPRRMGAPVLGGLLAPVERARWTWWPSGGNGGPAGHRAF